MNVVRALEFSFDRAGADQPKQRPLVSVVVPAYNEAAILEKNLARLYHYLESLAPDYRWEIIIVNDGSKDATGELAEAFAGTREHIRVLHHRVNLNLGQALRTAFCHCRGDYIVTMDIDLSYSPDHIGRMLEKLQELEADLVLASPYMEGGQCSNVPRDREALSRSANRYLSLLAKGNLATLTGMVRAYDGRFLRGLNLKSMGMEINTEIIYKAQLLNARIAEIPAHLHWEAQPANGVQRQSHIKIARHIGKCLFTGFIFRPAAFFLAPGVAALLAFFFTLGWAFFRIMAQYQNFEPSIGAALAATFQQAPHIFLSGGISMLLAAQCLGLGLLALQNKHYFEELFHRRAMQ